MILRSSTEIARAQPEVTGHLRKMRTELGDPVRYYLELGTTTVCLNDMLGHTVRLAYGGAIQCHHCGRATRKSFNQGYCWPCFKSLAACDTCIVSPERCHFDAGTCREPDWAASHCHQPHIVYLANSTGLKVGITRATQLPARWIDQGATQALPMLSVATRQQAGLAEVIFKQHVADRTNWRAMLKGNPEPLDLVAERDRLLALCNDELTALQARFPAAVALSPSTAAQPIHYPVLQFPTKIASLDFEKTAVVEGVLTGIKGQYLLLDSGVINLRKFGAYQVTFTGTVAEDAGEAADASADGDAAATINASVANQAELSF